MTFFFLVVGLEAKRELDMGELRERRRVAIPLIAAAGGMLAPVAIYLALNAGGPGAGGWGAAMSTDTAFALGVLALVASGATRLRVRLLTIVVIDDLVALLVIATVYTEDVSLLPLAVAFALFAALVALRYAPGDWRMPAALALGVALWARAPQVRHRSGDRRSRGGTRHERLPARARRPGAGDRADAVVPRAAHPRAGALGTAERGVRDLRQRAAPAQAPPLDRLRDRAAVRARQRGNPRGRRPAGGRRHVTDHPGDPARLRGRQAARDHHRHLAGARDPGSAACSASLSWPTIVGGGAVAGIGFTISLLISTQAFTGRQPRRGQARGARRRDRRDAAELDRVPRDREAAGLHAGSAAGRHSRRAARPGRRRGRARPRARPDGRSGHARGVRRLPVPLLRTGRGGDPRAARLVRRRPALRVAPPPAERRAPAGPDGGRGGGGRRVAGRLLGDARSAARPSGRAPALRTSSATPPRSASTSTASGTTSRAASTPRAWPRTWPAPTRAAWPARPPSSSTASATRAPTTFHTLTREVNVGAGARRGRRRGGRR